jgi:hypothetical protein
MAFFFHVGICDRQRVRWTDGVQKDLRNLGVVNLKTKAQERDGWRQSLQQVKGCSVNTTATTTTNNNNNNNNRLYGAGGNVVG